MFRITRNFPTSLSEFMHRGSLRQQIPIDTHRINFNEPYSDFQAEIMDGLPFAVAQATYIAEGKQGSFWAINCGHFKISRYVSFRIYDSISEAYAFMARTMFYLFE